MLEQNKSQFNIGDAIRLERKATEYFCNGSYDKDVVGIVIKILKKDRTEYANDCCAVEWIKPPRLKHDVNLGYLHGTKFQLWSFDFLEEARKRVEHTSVFLLLI